MNETHGCGFEFVCGDGGRGIHEKCETLRLFCWIVPMPACVRIGLETLSFWSLSRKRFPFLVVRLPTTWLVAVGGDCDFFLRNLFATLTPPPSPPLLLHCSLLLPFFVLSPHNTHLWGVRRERIRLLLFSVSHTHTPTRNTRFRRNLCLSRRSRAMPDNSLGVCECVRTDFYEYSYTAIGSTVCMCSCLFPGVLQQTQIMNYISTEHLYHIYGDDVQRSTTTTSTTMTKTTHNAKSKKMNDILHYILLLQ